jgi:hypothetical protein
MRKRRDARRRWSLYTKYDALDDKRTLNVKSGEGNAGKPGNEAMLKHYDGYRMTAEGVHRHKLKGRQLLPN